MAEHDFTYTQAPDVRCPECREVFVTSEERPEGDELACPHCGSVLCCDEKNVEIEWCWSVVKSGDSQPRREP